MLVEPIERDQIRVCLAISGVLDPSFVNIAYQLCLKVETILKELHARR